MRHLFHSFKNTTFDNTSFLSICGALGRPRTQPQSSCADTGYKSKDVLEVLAQTNIRAEIPQRVSVSPEGLVKRRRPGEKTIAWLKQFRGVRIRRDRKVHIYQAFVETAYFMIAFRKLNTI